MDENPKPVVDLSYLNTVSLLFSYLDVLPRHATWCAWRQAENVSKHVIVTNKGAKRRTVYEPSKVLYWIQTRIREGLLQRVPVDDCVHGFVPGRGCLTNARSHVPSLAGGEARAPQLLINVDLKDFFPGIGSRRVFAIFRTVFGFEPRVAAMLTRLTSYEDHLCQGFVTSPDIANIAAWRLDRRLKALAASLGMRYTRYADDLTFSADTWNGGVDGFLGYVREIVADQGFRVNEKKVAIMRRGGRQKVTGLVVSGDDARIPRQIRRRIQSACHHWPQQTPERKAAIKGWLSYIHSIQPQEALRLESVIARAESESGTRTWEKNVSQAPFEFDIQRKGRS